MSKPIIRNYVYDRDNEIRIRTDFPGLAYFMRAAGGPILAIILIIVKELLHLKDLDISIPILIGGFTIIILLSTLLGGLWPGISCASIVISYCIFYIFLNETYRLVFGSSVYMHIINILMLFSITIIAGASRRAVKQKAHALSESENKYELLFNSMNDGVILHELSDNNALGRIIDINMNLCVKLGYSRDELLLMSLLDITDEAYEIEIKTSRDILDKLFLIHEKNLISKDGMKIPVEISTQVINLNNKRIALAVFRDITDRKQMEMRLRESEEQYRKLAEFLPYGVYIHDDGKFDFVNKSGLDILGAASREEIVGKNVLEVVHPEYKDIVLNRIKTIREKGTSVPLIDIKVLTNVGNYIDVEVTTTPFPYKNKIALLVIAKVITERKRIEQALKESERKYRDLFNNMNDGIFIHLFDEDILKNRFVEVNDAACRMLGYNRNELLEMNLEDIRANKNLGFKKISGIIEAGSGTFESILISKYGVKIPVEVSSFSFMLDGKKVVQSTVRDVTKRKIVEEKLHESELRYRQLVELSPESIFIHAEGRVTYANKAAIKLLGAKSKDELINKSLFDIIAADYHISTIRRLNKLYSGNNVKPLKEIQLVRLDGSIVDVEVVTAPYPSGAGYGALAFIRDIQERKKIGELNKVVGETNILLKKVIESEHLKTEFFTNMSHELRTPLNVISSTLQLTEMYMKKNMLIDKDGKMNKHFNSMKQNCNRLLRLINNIIDISKIDSGYLKLNLQNANIINIVENITMSVAEYIESKEIRLEFDTEIEEKVLACDPDKIERIILNLLANAVKFTQASGSIKVNIYDRGDSLVISVKDSGIGIPKDKQELVFERYRQVDDSLTKSHEGSGIGLSLVKSLVEMHDGKVSLESELGKGSNFIIELPVKLCDEENHEIFNSWQSPVEKIQVEFSDIYDLDSTRSSVN